MIALADYNRSPHVGIFCAANDDYAIIPPGAQKSFETIVRDTLGVDIIRTSLLGSSLVSVFCALNSKKIIVPASAEEKAILAEHFDVIEISEKYTAVGNLVSMNDKGIVASSCLEGLADAEKVTVADSDLVGSCICASNSGFLAHRDANQTELKIISGALGVRGDVGTVNFGDPFVKSGLVANKRGVVAGFSTSGPELGRIHEVFGE